MYKVKLYPGMVQHWEVSVYAGENPTTEEVKDRIRLLFNSINTPDPVRSHQELTITQVSRTPTVKLGELTTATIPSQLSPVITAVASWFYNGSDTSATFESGGLVNAAPSVQPAVVTRVLKPTARTQSPAGEIEPNTNPNMPSLPSLPSVDGIAEALNTSKTAAAAVLSFGGAFVAIVVVLGVAVAIAELQARRVR